MLSCFLNDETGGDPFVKKNLLLTDQIVDRSSTLQLVESNLSILKCCTTEPSQGVHVTLLLCP
jgi:hypothetical protein